MRSNKTGYVLVVIFGILSFSGLIMTYLGLTDIWHSIGSPNFWEGQGANALEWKIATVSLWFSFAFHILFFISATRMMAHWWKPKGDRKEKVGKGS